MRIYKIVLVIFCSSLFIRCSVDNDDDKTEFLYDLVKIEEVDIPDEFVEDDTYTIIISYFRPSDCHSFFGFDSVQSDNEISVAVVNVYVEEESCSELNDSELIEESFDFTVGSRDSYVFNFWQSEDEFLTIEVPVIENN